MRVASVRTVNGNIELATPYVAEFVAALKVSIPHYARKWVPERKIWMISAEHRAPLLALVQRYFDVLDMDAEAQQQRDQTADSHAVLHLLPSAPQELIKAAYLCLAKLHHPDKGGDLRQMQALNRAYEKLHR